MHRYLTRNAFSAECELTSFEDWLEAKVTLHQILVEVHGRKTITNPATANFFDHMNKNGYVIFHKEPNIAHWDWGPNHKSCVEYAFLKLSEDFIGK